MKKNVLRCLVIALVLALLCGAALAEVRTTGNVWLRSGPGLGYEQITSFSKGKTLQYLGESSVDNRGVAWYKVSSGKYVGWVSSRYTELIGETVTSLDDEAKLAAIKAEVAELLAAHPLYPELG